MIQWRILSQPRTIGPKTTWKQKMCLSFALWISFAIVWTREITSMHHRLTHSNGDLTIPVRASRTRTTGNSFFIREQMLTIFGWNFEIWAVQRYVNLVDLVKSFPTSIFLQKSASIQPRTSLSKFGGKFNSLFIRLLTVGYGAGRMLRTPLRFVFGKGLKRRTQEFIQPRSEPSSVAPSGRGAARPPALPTPAKIFKDHFIDYHKIAIIE